MVGRWGRREPRARGTDGQQRPRTRRAPAPRELGAGDRSCQLKGPGLAHPLEAWRSARKTSQFPSTPNVTGPRKWPPKFCCKRGSCWKCRKEIPEEKKGGDGRGDTNVYTFSHCSTIT